MNNSLAQQQHLQRRRRAEKRFAFYGKFAIGLAMVTLAFLLTDIVSKGYSGFLRTEIRVPVASASEGEAAIRDGLRALFPEVTERREVRDLYGLVSNNAAVALQNAGENTSDIWLPASSLTDLFHKGQSTDAGTGKLSAEQEVWLNRLEKEGRLRSRFNGAFLSRGDSREPEQAGFLGSMSGSFFTLLVCIALAFPFGVMTAVYLEELAPKNRFADFIEVNINNLAAVPSIVFGLLGLALYLNLFGLPRSASLVGGLTLALMILPVIIITTRVALKAVPSSIRDAARALGASPIQVVFHHVLPYAMPGIMTGTILGMARAIGETAPLLMIGMVAFVADIPGNFTDPATAMPVQIYLWAGSPELGFVEKTSAGIIVLLLLLGVMNALAIYIRKRFEYHW